MGEDISVSQDRKMACKVDKVLVNVESGIDGGIVNKRIDWKSAESRRQKKYEYNRG